MKYIAHRGLLRGPDPTLENKISTIICTLNLGFDCEVDLWYTNDTLYLGHDSPMYKIDHNFLLKKGLWIHCKNFESLDYLTRYTKNLTYFWHEEDAYTLTSNGFIWAYPGSTLNSKSICVLPELIMDLKDINKLNCFGVCSDYLIKIKDYE